MRKQTLQERIDGLIISAENEKVKTFKKFLTHTIKINQYIYKHVFNECYREDHHLVR